MGDIGALAYLRLPSFMKRFSEDHSMDELRVPPEFVATHGDELPFDCRLVMSRGGRGWPVRLLKIASGCHFRVGWPEFRIINRIVQDDVFVFTMVQPGIFHVKRFKTRTGCPPVSDLTSVMDEDSDHSYAPDVDTSDDYHPSETENESSEEDDEEYAPEQGVVDVDGCPTFVYRLTSPTSIVVWRFRLLFGAATFV
ncbi:B3 domain-containing protein REM20-like [Salvia hispanica]|uniref:B3 domain-containing protein REM20-like n=1 Tax=Salvia hispanica TaxID=49212 RepID=UPI0020096BCF|nr:B3 domain-containing protein REM20-like [Salvia hispanica]